MYWGRGIPYRGCTFIPGGVYTMMHVYWGRGIPYRGCTFIPGDVHTRTHVYWGRGIHYRGCTFIPGGVHTRMHVYWGRGIHYRGCTFIAGGVHTRMHVYWGGASPTGGVPSKLGVCIPGCMCTGEGHPLQGVYLHSWGRAYQDACVLGRGIPYRGCTFIPGGVHTRTHVYWGGASTRGGVPS